MQYTGNAAMSLNVTRFYHPPSGTFSYVVSDPVARQAAIVDPVLDYDAAGGRTATAFADDLIAHVRSHGLELAWILETHAHADHLSAAPHIRAALGGRIAIGAGIREVQARFKKLFNMERGFLPDGSQFDVLFEDGDRFELGRLQGQVLATPGHTSDSISYLIGDAVFVGDTLFAPDAGTARCDFPGGDAALMYRSTRRLFELPDETRVFLCHDYPEGRDPMAQSTIGEQRRANIHVRDGISEQEYVRIREARDRTLELPTLILPAVQVNIRAGHLPPAEDNGVAYLKIPLNRL
jgi:glyoxylase-like metal-dependent hydrolase (beta-lactamase superfamily II)